MTSNGKQLGRMILLVIQRNRLNFPEEVSSYVVHFHVVTSLVAVRPDIFCDPTFFFFQDNCTIMLGVQLVL